MNRSAISCMFASHNKYKHVCALQSAYSIAQWLHFYTTTLQYVICPAQPAYHWCFPDWAWTLLQHNYCLNEETKKVSLYLDDKLRTQVKIEAPWGRALLNDTQWFILVTFKDNIRKGEVHELGDSPHTLSMHCGRHTRITSENTQVLLSKKDWAYLMELASACTDRQVIRFSRLQNYLVEGWSKFTRKILFYTSKWIWHWFR